MFAFAYRQQRIASSKGNSTTAAPTVNGAAPKQAQEVVVAYASQTGTAQEIARNIQAESSKHGIQSKVPHLLRIAVHELHQYKHAASHRTNRPFNTNAILQRVLQFMLLSYLSTLQVHMEHATNSLWQVIPLPELPVLETL